MGDLLSIDRVEAAGGTAIAKGLRAADLEALQSANFSQSLGGLLAEWDSAVRGGSLFRRMRIVLREIAFNVPLKRAVAIAGVSGATVEDWCRTGDRVVESCPENMGLLEWLSSDACELSIAEKECAAFSLLIGMVDSLAQSRLVGVMTELAVGRQESIDDDGVVTAGFRPSFQATAWLLERRWPEEWGPPKQRLDVSQESVSVDVHVSQDSLSSVLEKLSEFEGSLSARGMMLVDGDTSGVVDAEIIEDVSTPPISTDDASTPDDGDVVDD